jgi:hypothetical protein
MSGYESSAFEAFLSRLIQSPDRHARFVNTLSMLEYIGVRKIFKSQKSEAVSLLLLQHAADEIRHAKLLKKAALGMSNGELDSYREEHLLCGKSAQGYFQSVDHLSESINLDLTDVQKYELTTWLVERRVLKVYPLYEKVLSRDDQFEAQRAVIGAILKDEARHLNYVAQDLMQRIGVSKEVLEQLSKDEEARFQSLEQSWFSKL